ncbi:DUF5362 family protein [Bernardetia sp. Wsw4-3y2]|uniref:DUF5362 family protein n=1 Tax=unclassified Bernardetia TaxID=2647129 RepID=UPI0030D036B0
MQNDNFLDKDSFYSETGFQITNRSKNFLATAAFWGKIVAILGFLFTALMVLIIVAVFFTDSSDINQEFGNFGLVSTKIGIVLIYFLTALAYLIPSLYLFFFAQKTQESIRHSDNKALEEGFKNLKSLFKFAGIITLLTLVLFGLVLVFFMFVGASM